MAKLTTDPVGNFNSEGLTTLNANFDKVEAALENTLSRDGSVPNQMEADLDMNHNDIINVDNLHAETIVLNGETLHPEEVVVTGALMAENNLSDVPDPAAARANLGITEGGPDGDISGARSLAEVLAENPADFQTVMFSNGLKQGHLRWDATVPVATHQGTGKNAIYYPPNDSVDGAYVKVLTRGVEARDFDVRPDFTGAQNSANLQKAVNYAIENNIGLLTLPHGTIPLATQIMVEKGPNQTFSLDIEGSGQWTGTTLKSSVIGAVAGGVSDGFLFVIDGMRQGHWRNFQIDYSGWAADTVGNAGGGGIIFRCRNRPCFNNTLSNMRFVGGVVVSDRELNKSRSVVFVGQEPESSNTGWATYFNQVTNCSFNIAHKHIELITGGADQLEEPNANNSTDCLFERYIIGIDITGCEETRHIGHFFQAAAGVPGVNGGFTDAVKTSGFGHLIIISGEAGANSRGVHLAAASSQNMCIVQTNFASGNIDLAGVGVNTIIDRGRINPNRITMNGGFDFRAVSTGGLPGSPRPYESYIVTNPPSGNARMFFWDPVSGVWRDAAGVAL